MAKNDTASNDIKSTSALYSGSISLLVFWLLIVLAEVSGPIKSTLDFYPAVGPLLGKFLFALIAFVVSYYALVNYLGKQNKSELEKHERKSAAIFVAVSILIFLLTFPPVFEPIVEIFK